MLASPAMAGNATDSSRTTCMFRGKAVTQQSDVRRQEVFSETMTNLLRQDLSIKQIDQILAEDYGIEVKTEHDDAGTATPTGTPGDITLYKPAFYYDSCSRKYYAYARWAWPSMSQFPDELGWSPTCGVCDLGGDDGFGISFSRNVTTVQGYQVVTWGKTSFFPQRSDRMYPSDANTYGVTYRGQDRFCKVNANSACNPPGGDYNFANGALYYYIGSIGCGYIQAFSKYGHSWTSTELNGIGVGPWSITITWSSSSNRWQKQSGPSSENFKPC